MIASEIMKEDYDSFLARKLLLAEPVGFKPPADADFSHLFDFQRTIVEWALRRGRAAIFASTGLGKTLMQLTWAREVMRHTGCSILILAPLAVARQTEREAVKFKIDGVRYVRDQSEVTGVGIYITNYEMLSHFQAPEFGGVVIDESSCLKHHDSVTRNAIIESFSRTPFRLAATATPAPNDYVELGNHSEFLSIMSRVEMLSTFFVHDGSEGAATGWRCKGHAESALFRWICSWACMIRKPSDLGYDDAKFILPELRVKHHVIPADRNQSLAAGSLFVEAATTLSKQRVARRATLDKRVAMTASIVNAEPTEQWIVWGDLNDETDDLTRQIPGAVQVKGSDSRETKEDAILQFLEGKIRVIVSKSSIFGFGLNLQCCARMAFCGVTHSWEAWFQAVRRIWRFNQLRECDVHVVTSELEGRVVDNLMRKEAAAEEMAVAMLEHMHESMVGEIRGASRHTDGYDPRIEMAVPNWLAENSRRT